MMTLSEEKAELRRRMRDLRSAMRDAERERMADAATEQLVSMPEAVRARTVFVFRSFGAEISTARAIERFSARGVRLALPALVGGVMHAAEYRPGDPLAPSDYGALEPVEGRPVEPDALDLIVVPGLAFDAEGHRLGYGGGYYDAFLPATRPDAVRVGFAFDAQVVRRVPHGEHDARLDAVVTDARVIRPLRG
jgi:5-formyltetrahydrofolate cyclo-ligase